MKKRSLYSIFVFQKVSKINTFPCSFKAWGGIGQILLPMSFQLCRTEKTIVFNPFPHLFYFYSSDREDRQPKLPESSVCSYGYIYGIPCYTGAYHFHQERSSIPVSIFYCGSQFWFLLSQFSGLRRFSLRTFFFRLGEQPQDRGLVCLHLLICSALPIVDDTVDHAVIIL